MKRKVITLLVLASTALGAISNAATSGELPGVAPQPASYFYTGKPYDSALGAYVFNYRNYDSDLNRWTTADPSGFPDGANSYKYGSSPCSGLDPNGLTWAEAMGMFWNWITGTGDTLRTFGEDSDWVNDLKDAPGVNTAREMFHDKNAGLAPENYTALTNFSASFGLSGLWAAGGDSTQQFLGSYRIDILPRADEMKAEYIVTNTTSATSFFYGLAPSWERDSFTPGGNMAQTYTWKEPLE